MSDEDRNRFWSELDKQGEPAVQAQMKLGNYGQMGSHFVWATEWLARRSASSQAETRDIARSAKDAAWEAARAARAANTRATIALVIAAISIIITIVIPYLQKN